MKHLVGGSLALLLAAAPGADSPALAGTAPSTMPRDRADHSSGHPFGTQPPGLARQGAGATLRPRSGGLADAATGALPLMDGTALAAAGDGLAAVPSQQATDNRVRPGSPFPVRARGYVDDYAALNAEREGVVVLSSGLQYEVLAEGTGRRATADATVAVRYRATLANGVEFDSTYDREEPALLRIDQLVVPGLREALPLMKEGDKWRITIPAYLGYGGKKLLRKRDLIYELELVSVQPDGG